MEPTVPDCLHAALASRARLEPLRHVEAGVLDIAYYEAGPADGPVVMLLHGFPYDIHSYVDVAPMLAAQGCRVIVPYLRGYGPTRFRDAATPRSGEQAAIGADLMALMDALAIPRAVFAGYDWGGRAACIGAALWPERCTGLVSVNGYLIQDIARRDAAGCAGARGPLWYQYYFQTRARPRRARRQPARASRAYCGSNGRRNWEFDDATFERTAVGARQSRLCRCRDPQLPASLRARRRRSALCRSAAPARGALPPITVPTITLDGDADGVVPATDGSAHGREVHRSPCASGDPACRPQSAAGGAGRLCGGGDGTGYGVIVAGRRMDSSEKSRGLASRFDQLDRLLVEGDEGLGAEPAPFIGDSAIGEVAAGLEQRQSCFRHRPVHDDVVAAKIGVGSYPLCPGAESCSPAQDPDQFTE